ncbi:hypothetical protein R1T40_22195 (plasmid) [Tritonibacter scottomollicae]|uniref:Uncharacterized protein n=1 Tax=Tritonibacter scottomollicae TaxID=483013 RepID=A0ABZ0HMF5_TRISK|nr:hypothetical protein [Tritonibacter scottomollicae]WOI35451.1 hypothetical protein R1T40_22195 [Tritonibacter scottomollicae]
MENAEDIITTVLRRIPLPENEFAPECRFWLTLYLEGNPIAYVQAKPPLHALGWLNLCENDDFAGFVYPKKKVLNAPAQIADALRDALSVCKKMGMKIGLVDADTEFEPIISSFHNLYKSS